MSKLSLGSGNRNSQRYLPGWKYTGTASVCRDYSDKFSPPEPLKQTFIVSQSWRLKSKTVVLAAHTPTKPPGQVPPCVPASTGSRHPLVRAVSLLLSSPGHCLCVCLSPLPSSDKDSRLVGLGPTPRDLLYSWWCKSTHNTVGVKAWLLDVIEYGILSMPLTTFLCKNWLWGF